MLPAVPPTSPPSAAAPVIRLNAQSISPSGSPTKGKKLLPSPTSLDDETTSSSAGARQDDDQVVPLDWHTIKDRPTTLPPSAAAPEIRPNTLP
eukprot:838791-Prymnesium_polylepis.1